MLHAAELGLRGPSRSVVTLEDIGFDLISPAASSSSSSIVAEASGRNHTSGASRSTASTPMASSICSAPSPCRSSRLVPFVVMGTSPSHGSVVRSDASGRTQCGLSIPAMNFTPVAAGGLTGHGSRNHASQAQHGCLSIHQHHAACSIPMLRGACDPGSATLTGTPASHASDTLRMFSEALPRQRPRI